MRQSGGKANPALVTHWCRKRPRCPGSACGAGDRRQRGKADEYRAAETGLLGFFVGNVMRQSGGEANPELVSNLVRGAAGGLRRPGT
jgi:Asp-tRNA(Asn)/Glu-tRNA(Gln) amidotransferase B subunit